MKFNKHVQELSEKYSGFPENEVIRLDGDLSTESDIYYCFRLILGRKPLAKEWQGHLKASLGQPLIDLVAKYVSSLEFSNRNLTASSIQEWSHQLVDLEEFKLWVSPKDNVCGILTETDQYDPHVSRHIELLPYAFSDKCGLAIQLCRCSVALKFL